MFGGRFDPFHNLHLAIVRRAAADLPVERVVVIPNGSPPHDTVNASWHHRLKMASIGCSSETKVEVAALEPEGFPCRTIDTLAKLSTRGTVPILIVGSDAFAKLTSWWRWRNLLTAVNWAIVPRNSTNWLPDQPELKEHIDANQVDVSDQLANGSGKVWAWPKPLGKISASDIRRRITVANRGWTELMPTGVAKYVQKTACTVT